MTNHRGFKLCKAKGRYTENGTANKVQMSRIVHAASSSIPIAVAATPILFNCSTWFFIVASRARQTSKISPHFFLHFFACCFPRCALTNLKGEKLNYKSVAKEISKPPFLAPEVQWASKFTVFVWFTFPLIKCFEPRPYLVCHVTTIEYYPLQ